MKDLNKYVDQCIESVLKHDEQYGGKDDMGLRCRLHFALGYMENSKEVRKLLWAIAYGEKLVEEN